MNARQLLSALGVPAALLAFVPAHAALPDGVASAITTAQTDILALLAALIGAGVAIWVVRLIARRFSVKA